MLIGYLFAFAVVINAGAALLWSLGGGLEILKQSYQYTPNRQARRLLAWSLIAPGLTAASTAAILLFQNSLSAYLENTFGLAPTSIARPIIATVAATSPMSVVYLLIPLAARLSGNPSIRWAVANIARFGIPALIITIVTLWTNGLAIVIAIPYLLWLVKKIRRWNTQLEAQADYQTFAIEDSKEGLRVMPSNPHGPDHFNIL